MENQRPKTPAEEMREYIDKSKEAGAKKFEIGQSAEKSTDDENDRNEQDV